MFRWCPVLQKATAQCCMRVPVPSYSHAVSIIVWGCIPKNQYKKGRSSVYYSPLGSCVCVFKCIYFIVPTYICLFIRAYLVTRLCAVCSLPAEHIIIVHTCTRMYMCTTGGADAVVVYRGKNWFIVQRPIDPGEDVPRARVFVPPPLPRTSSLPLGTTPPPSRGSNTKPTDGRTAVYADRCCWDGYHPSVTGLVDGAGEVSKCW